MVIINSYLLSLGKAFLEYILDTEKLNPRFWSTNPFVYHVTVNFLLSTQLEDKTFELSC